MTPEMVHARRRAGVALSAAIIALWLSVFPWGAFALILRIVAMSGFIMAVRWAVDPDHPTRRRVAAIAVLLGVMVQLQNFFHRLTLGPDSAAADYTRFFLADHGVPALLVLGISLLPRLGRRKSETALLWLAFALTLVFTLVGTANGSLMATRGEPSEADYHVLVVLLRSVSLAPALAAAIMLLVPAREVLTEEQAWKRVEELHAQTRASLQEAANALEEADANKMVSPTPLPLAPSTSPIGTDTLTLLEGRLARGEISEATYLMLRQKYQT